MKSTFLLVVIVFFLLSLSPVHGQNLLQNPGFENWLDDTTCQYWYTETTAVDAHKESDIIHSGTFSAKLILRSTVTQRFTQYVAPPINPGNEYEGTLFFFDNDPFIRARLYIRWFDGSGEWISSFWSSYSVDSAGWQELTAGPDSAPAAAETAHVEVRLYDVNGFTDSALIYVDDASFVDLTSGVSETGKLYNDISLRIFPTLTMNSVSVNLSISRKANTEISIYSISGRKISTLVSKELNHGKYTFVWNASDAPTGIYYIKANLQEETITEKVTILR